MFTSYSITQAYYRYIQYYAYNVVPAVINLNFDSTPSSNPNDYKAIVVGGTLDAPLPLGFSLYDNSLVISGNTASLTLPVVANNNSYVQVSYQGSNLPFHVRASQDQRYVQPSICIGIGYALPIVI